MPLLTETRSATATEDELLDLPRSSESLHPPVRGVALVPAGATEAADPKAEYISDAQELRRLQRGLHPRPRQALRIAEAVAAQLGLFHAHMSESHSDGQADEALTELVEVITRAVYDVTRPGCKRTSS